MKPTVIVGAGIAGLWVAHRLVQQGEKHIIIVEAYNYLGGRIVTGPGYEIGAGRVHTSHRMVTNLVRRYGLHTHEISSQSVWMPLGSTATPNYFKPIWKALLHEIRQLPTATLATTTLRDLVKTHGFESLLEQFPYRTELDHMRADMAIRAFDEMFGQFYVVKEGLHAIIKGLETELRAAGVKFRMKARVQDVRELDGVYHIMIKGCQAILASRVILALHATALRNLPCMAEHRILQHVDMAPLTRIYAQYPTAWYPPTVIVTDSPLRHIIPINTNGLVMISYTDGRDTKRLSSLKEVQQEVRRLFSDKGIKDIPEPTWIKAYEWKEGTTFWAPGDYSPEEESRAILRPRPATMPELYVCGESFSMKQAWIEGALEHADMLFTTHLARS